MEREARERLQQLRSLLERNPVEARKVLDALLDGPLTLTPTETSDGKRFRIEGTVTTGALLAVYDSSSSVPRGI
jgi:tRNA A37 threonylcarbamoyladenosine synthetase subunit TsaC/SUA5/YrdC